jgi:hypothetical protein
MYASDRERFTHHQAPAHTVPFQEGGQISFANPLGRFKVAFIAPREVSRLPERLQVVVAAKSS